LIKLVIMMGVFLQYVLVATCSYQAAHAFCPIDYSCPLGMKSKTARYWVQPSVSNCCQAMEADLAGDDGTGKALRGHDIDKRERQQEEQIKKMQHEIKELENAAIEAAQKREQAAKKTTAGAVSELTLFEHKDNVVMPKEVKTVDDLQQSRWVAFGIIAIGALCVVSFVAYRRTKTTLSESDQANLKASLL
jgi:hypothetical protein